MSSDTPPAEDTPAKAPAKTPGWTERLFGFFTSGKKRKADDEEQTPAAKRARVEPKKDLFEAVQVTAPPSAAPLEAPSPWRKPAPVASPVLVRRVAKKPVRNPLWAPVVDQRPEEAVARLQARVQQALAAQKSPPPPPKTLRIVHATDPMRPPSRLAVLPSRTVQFAAELAGTPKETTTRSVQARQATPYVVQAATTASADESPAIEAPPVPAPTVRTTPKKQRSSKGMYDMDWDLVDSGTEGSEGDCKIFQVCLLSKVDSRPVPKLYGDVAKSEDKKAVPIAKLNEGAATSEDKKGSTVQLQNSVNSTAADEEPWTCSQCSTSNPNDESACTKCNARRSSGSAGQSLADQFSFMQNKWKCSSCTLPVDPSLNVCPSCEAPREGSNDGTSSEPQAGGSAKQSFSFGTSTPASDAKPISFGAPSTGAATKTASQFSFGAPPEGSIAPVTESKFSFGAPSTGPSTKTDAQFSFGAQPEGSSAPVSESKSISFGAQSTGDGAVATGSLPAFSFGAASAAGSSTPKTDSNPTLTSGSQANAASFVFGGTAPSDATNGDKSSEQGTSDDKPKFGSFAADQSVQKGKTPNNGGTEFKFGSSEDKGSTPSGGFSFGTASSAAPAEGSFTFGQPSPAMPKASSLELDTVSSPSATKSKWNPNAFAPAEPTDDDSRRKKKRSSENPSGQSSGPTVSTGTSQGFSFGAPSPVPLEGASTVVASSLAGFGSSVASKESSMKGSEPSVPFQFGAEANSNVVPTPSSSGTFTFGATSASGDANASGPATPAPFVFGQGSAVSSAKPPTAANPLDALAQAASNDSSSSQPGGFTFVGQPSSSASTFGQTTAAAPAPFGQPSSSAPTFGQPTAAAPAPFGQPPVSAPAPFGQPPATAPAPFGQPPATAPAPFGQPPASAPAPFGQPFGQSAPAVGGFGTSAGFGQSSVSSQGQPFGSSSGPSGFGGSFGQSAPAPMGGFGQQPPSAMGGFAAAAPSGFGQSSGGFGQAPAAGGFAPSASSGVGPDQQQMSSEAAFSMGVAAQPTRRPGRRIVRAKRPSRMA